MKHARLTLLALLSSLLLSGCGKEPEPAIAPEDRNALLSHVPAGSPYLLANLEPIPEQIVDSYLTRLQPVLDTMQARLETAISELESAGIGAPESDGDPGARILHALLRELDGKLSRNGLESLGLDLGAHKVIYGMGAFPVLRLGLSDSEALRATVQRVFDNADVDVSEREFRGVPYWRMSDDGASDTPIAAYVSILDDHLVAAAFPPMAEDQLLPGVLGLEMPPGGDAESRLLALNQAHAYTHYGSGILDVHRLADEFLRPDPVMSAAMAARPEFAMQPLSEICIEEIHGIIDHAPRMTMGTVELSASAVAVQYRIETPGDLARQLLGLTSRIPGIEISQDRLLELAFGVRFGAVRDFLREKAALVVENPYQCEHLARLNEGAAESLAKLDQPMPPFVNNFRGVRASLNDMSFSPDALPTDARGHLAVEVEQPQMFVGMAQMFLPDLSTLTLVPGEPPVRLPDSLLPVPGMVAFAALTDEAIGLSLGAGEEESLPAFLARPAGPEGMLFDVWYDTAAYLEHSAKLQGHYTAASQSGDPAADAANSIAEAGREAFRAMADRSRLTTRFTEQGFVADSRTSFR
jgi:hypothetical protein